MGRRRRRWREPQYFWWIGFICLAGAAVFLGWWRLGLMLLLVWCLYEFALIPTVCRVVTRQGFSCREPVRGRLFACTRGHQQVKNDALWRIVGLPNPFRRKITGDPSRSTGVVVYSPPVRGRLTVTDRALLVLASVGSLVTLVGTFLGLFKYRG